MTFQSKESLHPTVIVTVPHYESLDSTLPTKWYRFFNKTPVKEFDTTKTLRLSSLSVREALLEMDTSLDGLTLEESILRLEKYGPNKLSVFRPVQWYTMLFYSIIHPFNILLCILAVSNVAIPPADYRPFTYIMFMFVLATVLRFIQELKSSNAIETLQKLVKTHSVIIRRERGEKGTDHCIEQIDVVPGDIVKLTAGTLFPADCIILQARDLFVSQSSMTGESMPIEKVSSPTLDPRVGLLSRTNLGLMGTSVVSGIGLALVVCTADQTYLSAITAKLSAQKEISAFEKGVNGVSKLLIIFMLSMVPIVIVIQGLTGNGWIAAVQFGLSVAVGLVPEMLPLVVNANLAKGAISLTKKKAVVKQLAAIQNMGAMDVLCSDKTGTLTEDQITLMESLSVFGEKTGHPLEYGYLNSYFQTGLRNLLDQAILEAVYNGIEGLSVELINSKYSVVDEIPFEFVRRRVSVILACKTSTTTTHTLVCKGAFEEVLSCCSTYLGDDGEAHQLTQAMRAQFIDMIAKLNSEGLRVLGVAIKLIEQKDATDVYSKADECELTLQGFLSFLDPPKETAIEAIRLLAKQSVAIKV